MGGRVGPLWRIKQAPEEIQGGNTQCEHPERKSLRGSENTIPQESGCLLHSRDQIPWWQLPHNGKDTRFKLCWSGNDKGIADVGVFVAEEWIEKVFEVQRLSDRIILVKPIVGQRVVTFLSVYAPQSGLSDQVKDLFFAQLRAVTARWDGVWQAGTRCWRWENPRVRPSIWPASWEHMFQETWQPSHHIQVGKHSHADRLHFSVGPCANLSQM